MTQTASEAVRARSELPRTMRAMVLHQWGGEFRAEERPVPEPQYGQVLVRVSAVGAGVTNELARQGVLGGSLPRIHGHEFSGEVVALGPGVQGWSFGDRVTTTFYLLCGHCQWCTSGRETLCENFGGFIGIAVDGAFAEYVALPAENLIRIPDGVDFRDAGIISDAVATGYHVVAERLRLRAGQRAAVVGAGGGLGVHVLQMMRAFGAYTIAVEIDRAKADEIERRGLADALVVPEGDSWAGQLREAAGDRLTGIVDTVATEATFEQGFAALGRAGTLGVLGHVPGARPRIDPERLLLEELVVTGTRYATRAEIDQTMELVRLGRVRPIVGAHMPLEQLNEALEDANAQRVFGRIVLDVAEPRVAATEMRPPAG
jgi:D-arabinose 1-dehydrogenase-like Zn-dependent alcohol dehydrogenase